MGGRRKNWFMASMKKRHLVPEKMDDPGLDPREHQRALAGLGLEPRQAWHVGDSPEDGAGARAAGLPCLLLRRL